MKKPRSRADMHAAMQADRFESSGDVAPHPTGKTFLPWPGLLEFPMRSDCEDKAQSEVKLQVTWIFLAHALLRYPVLPSYDHSSSQDFSCTFRTNLLRAKHDKHGGKARQGKARQGKQPSIPFTNARVAANSVVPKIKRHMQRRYGVCDGVWDTFPIGHGARSGWVGGEQSVGTSPELVLAGLHFYGMDDEVCQCRARAGQGTFCWLMAAVCCTTFRVPLPHASYREVPDLKVPHLTLPSE